MFLTKQPYNWVFLSTGFMVLATWPSLVMCQDWPSTIGNAQAEFEVNREQLTESNPKKTKSVSRGRLGTLAPSRTENFGQLLRREVINPFEDGATRSSAPLVQTLPEEVIIPEIPDVLVYEQINLDEFRNYLTSLIADPPTQSKPQYSEEDIKKALGKISISALVVKPTSYAAINGNKFHEGDRFSLAMPAIQDNSGIEALIENQMPDANDVSKEIYAKFEEIKNNAIAEYRKRQQERLAQTGASKHNISVIVKTIEHRKLIVSVNGKDYVIPLRLEL